ncbi:hypothetical protein B7D74_11890, partial [Klebsiella pneumoniae]
QTFRRLWPIIAPFKAGLIVAAVALVLNAGSDGLVKAAGGSDPHDRRLSPPHPTAGRRRL